MPQRRCPPSTEANQTHAIPSRSPIATTGPATFHVLVYVLHSPLCPVPQQLLFIAFHRLIVTNCPRKRT